MAHAPRDESQIETETLRRKRTGIDWKSILAWAGPAGLTIAGWAHGVLWSHDTRLTTLEVQRQAAVQEIQQHQERDVRAQAEIRETLRRLEDKLDRLTERNSR